VWVAAYTQHVSTKDQKFVLFFDGDCSFCVTCAKVAKRLKLRAEFQPIQSVDLVAFGVDPVRARLEVPARLEDGNVVYGHHAIAAVLNTGALPLRLVGQTLTSAPLNPLSAKCYRAVATHRHWISKGISTGKQALDTLKRVNSGRTSKNKQL